MRRDPSLHAAWTDTRRTAFSALAELERQRVGVPEEGHPRRFLTWAERQRRVDASLVSMWTMLVAIGMLCLVSMSLTGPNNDYELIKLLNERVELPFVPHEAETLDERQKVVVKERDIDSDAEEDVLLLKKKHEFISKDEGDTSLEWVEKPAALGELMFKGGDYHILHAQAPPELVPLVESLLKEERALKQRAQGHYKVVDLLQQDLVALGELMLLCRILASTGSPEKTQAERLRELLKVSAKRFAEEWPAALSLTKYIADARERNLYLRLISHVASATDAMRSYILADYGQEGSSELQLEKAALSRKVMTGRFEIHRLLDEANFFGDIAEVFRAD